MKPFFNVVGAAIVKKGKLLALRRSGGIDSVIHKFEFVGGKIEDGETPEQALRRECREELSLEVEVGERLTTVNYEYPEYTVGLSVYLCKMLSDYSLSEHEEEAWMDCTCLSPEEWAPADGEFLNILRKGYVRFRKAESSDDFAIINRFGSEAMHRTFDSVSAEGQTDYMANLFLTDYSIRRNIKESLYVYKIIQLNGEDAGFFAYCPAQYFDEKYTGGTYLSKVYFTDIALGKRISSKIFASLPRPIVLMVKKSNTYAVNVYKHSGFKIVGSMAKDNGQSYVMDDFIMELM